MTSKRRCFSNTFYSPVKWWHKKHRET